MWFYVGSRGLMWVQVGFNMWVYMDFCSFNVDLCCYNNVELCRVMYVYMGLCRFM